MTVLSDSLLGRLVVNCSGITAFGSEGREKTEEMEDSASIVTLNYFGWIKKGLNIRTPSL